MEVVTIKDKTQRQVLMLEASEAEMAANILDWLNGQYDVLDKKQQRFVHDMVNKVRSFNGGR